MIKADKYYIQNLKEILFQNNIDENPRPSYKDGTKAHTKFITQVFEKYDILKGEFPITTLRNTAIKTGIKEMLVIYQEQSNKLVDFETAKCGWWSEWMNEDGDLGRAYSHNMESHRPNEMQKTIVKVKPRIVDEKYSEMLNIMDINDTSLVANPIKIFENYQLIREDKKSRKYVLQNISTGEIQVITHKTYKKLLDGDPSFLIRKSPFLYCRNNEGVGYLGNYKTINGYSDATLKLLRDKWVNMLRRCYSDKYESHNDVFVHQDWHSFENFLRDVRMLPQYHLAKENNFDGWDLDKDYYGSNCYSKDTCVFLCHKDNVLYASCYPIKVTKPNGNIEHTINIRGFCAEHNLSKTCLLKVINGKQSHHKGYKFEKIIDTENLYRYELSNNQLTSLLDGLENNPFGRRHIMSFWNWSNIDKKELVECAFESLWTPRKVDGVMYLDMTLTQRSQDAIMATYINKTQYVALQMMVCKHLGFEVGVFSHMIQNYHIYDRHVNACNELLARKPLNFQPSMKLNVPNKTNFYEIKIQDFEIITSKNIKKIESELEIAI